MSLSWPARLLVLAAAVAAAGCGSDTSSKLDQQSATATDAGSVGFAEPTSALPGGGRVLFNVEQVGPSQPATIDEDGIHLIPVPPDPTLAHVTWASDSGILYDTERSGPRQIHRMNIDGSDDVQLTTGPESQGGPDLSPDGSRLVFGAFITGSAPDQDLGIRIADGDGANMRDLTGPEPVGSKGGYTCSAFSPDAKWIAYCRAADFERGRIGVWIMRADGTDARRLTSDAANASYARWSPDGRRILYTENQEDLTAVSHRLWVVDVAGGPPRGLTEPADSGLWSEGDWSPDGNTIVAKYWRPGWDHNELRLMKADGTDVRTLWVSPSRHSAETPDWANQPRRVVPETSRLRVIAIPHPSHPATAPLG